MTLLVGASLYAVISTDSSLLIPLNSTWIALEINHLLRLVLLPHKPEDNLEELFPGFFGDRVVFSHDVLRRDVKGEKLSAEVDFASCDIALL